MCVTQVTLEGDETDAERVKPDTFKWCLHCDEFVLRSKWEPHERHDWEARGRYADNDRDDYDPRDEEEGSDTTDEPETVGGWFDVTISRSVDYRFRVPAWDKHRAKELAEEWAWDATPADSHTVHTDVSEQKKITTDDVPDDFDPYGSTELWEVFEDE